VSIFSTSFLHYLNKDKTILIKLHANKSYLIHVGTNYLIHVGTNYLIHVGTNYLIHVGTNDLFFFAQNFTGA
jgi:hypothetical protein